jgi:hypothetical protein
MNRAVQGDIVAVEVFPKSEWKAPADAVVDQDGARLGQLPAVKLNSVHSCLARRRRGRFGRGRRREPWRIHRASTGEQTQWYGAAQNTKRETPNRSDCGDDQAELESVGPC